MFRLEFESYKSVGNVSFLESREAVRKELGEFSEFKKNKYSENTTDDFKGLHVYYDKENTVEAIEIFKENELLYKNTNLFSLNFSQIKEFLADNHIEEDDSSCIFYTIGLSVYAPEKNKIESILIFKKDYYN